MNHDSTLHIDCGRCVMQHTTACDDCLVSVVLQISEGAEPTTFVRIGPSEEPVDFDEVETSAIHALAEVGLIPRLRLVPREDEDDPAQDASPPPGAPGTKSA